MKTGYRLTFESQLLDVNKMDQLMNGICQQIANLYPHVTVEIFSEEVVSGVEEADGASEGGVPSDNDDPAGDALQERGEEVDPA